MTDGTTGIQVAPITEDDMNKVTSILKRAADAIVGMSQLAADVDMLRQTVTTLQQDCERLRNQNNALDEALAHSRQVRDDQARELAATKDTLARAEQDRDHAKQDAEYALGEFKSWQDKYSEAAHARDGAQLRVLELEDALASANASLDKIKAAHETIFGATQAPAMPTPTPPPYQEPMQAPEGASLSDILGKPVPPVQATSDPYWASEPSPVHVDPETSPDWKPGFYWDASRQLYVKH